MQNVKSQIMGPCNLTGGYQGSVRAFFVRLLTVSEGIPRMLLQNILSHVPGYTVS
jgi:hypothetical protein